jgi:hypothetical protein
LKLLNFKKSTVKDQLKDAAPLPPIGHAHFLDPEPRRESIREELLREELLRGWLRPNLQCASLRLFLPEKRDGSPSARRENSHWS